MIQPFEDTTTFKAKPKETSRQPNDKIGIVTRSRKERRPEVKETPMDELFETEYVPTDDMLAKVRDLMSRHCFLRNLFSVIHEKYVCH